MGTFQMWLTALLLGAVAQVKMAYFVPILIFLVNLLFVVLIPDSTVDWSFPTDYTLTTSPKKWLVVEFVSSSCFCCANLFI